MLTSVIGALDGTDIIGDLPTLTTVQITRAMVGSMMGIYFKKILTKMAKDESLDMAVRCVAASNISDEISLPVTSCDLSENDKIGALRIVKRELRKGLHEDLKKMYGDKYEPFRRDTDTMVDMLTA
jgi:hypothetical protein